MSLINGFTENPISALIHLSAVRYVTISGTTVLVYDTLLSLPDEIRLVWLTLVRPTRSEGSSVPLKILYLLARYTMIVVCIIALIMMMPVTELSDKWLAHIRGRCANATVFTGAADIVLESIASGVVFYRLYKLWGFGRRGKLVLSATFITGKAIVWIFTFVNMARIDHTVSYFKFPPVQTCSTLDAPRLALGVWVPDAILDISLVLFFILNALSRPRLKSESLIGIIYKDGIQFFLTMICMRTINVVFTAFAPPSLFFLGTIFSGAMVTTVSSRVFLSLFDATAQEKSILESEAYGQESISMTLCWSKPRSTHVSNDNDYIIE